MSSALMLNRIFLFFTLAICSSSFGYFENDNPDQFARKTVMNGYKLSDYKDFKKKWKLVTVRYRKDTGELRFTYANPLAWKSLMAGSVDYPDGAVFAKIGLMTEGDPAFTSSAVPSGVRRYQLMVRNKKKHAETDGWGYALFDSKGVTFPEDPKTTTRSCAACHHIVADRGYVFSQPLEPSDAIKSIQAGSQTPNRSMFRKSPVSELSKKLQDLLAGEKEVSLLEGKLRKYIFQGTLDEITPTLISESGKSQRPAILASEDFSRFTVAKPSRAACAKGKSFEVIQTQLERDEQGERQIKKRNVCDE